MVNFFRRFPIVAGLSVFSACGAIAQEVAEFSEVCADLHELCQSSDLRAVFHNFASSATEDACSMNSLSAIGFLDYLLTDEQALAFLSVPDPLPHAMTAALFLAEGCSLDAIYYAEIATNMIATRGYDCRDHSEISSILTFLRTEAVAKLAEGEPRLDHFLGTRHSSLQGSQFPISSLEEALDFLFE